MHMELGIHAASILERSEGQKHDLLSHVAGCTVEYWPMKQKENIL